jgi:hypothetical protein
LNLLLYLAINDGGVLQEAESHAHVDPVQALRKRDAYLAEPLVFMGITFDGIL